ncbi:hypothetical protein A3F19_01455 [Candidatus Nomurabacteria bacterium RIFCSPHIGHO2_12_FULL_37_29]|uniref:Uncharacterized protein n=2 Tax=Candidatus Nomuraibacteriota TaxID=1752729 RepID=A0A1F6Y5F1_9BACT|nr:MAG: hypothetical protein A2727_00060 [Candidatus Nomurabacteria bacterium RIFCSPHIGHO2_01_FULL_37_110]OGI79367.1 MAG: hypothetical protein A3F19_01455 [Candidatus Nomurabacteria bacterium RIFCSPHIGHO2_12_FULL_37_29]OGI84826.1 MAG: hypothetical protein A3A92_00630 [Candidatus Nomurabacteria bacterium RIFCSPLOWO2_01_FULL_37_49]OGJ01588.1 MAG: hypothetical protein A3G98_02455 [Candidatus Nomurabacteria bacterium RIFCSPLOWO2_12_FULL_37_8]
MKEKEPEVGKKPKQNEEIRFCTICKRKLSMYNKTEECRFHTANPDFKPEPTYPPRKSHKLRGDE